MAKIFTPPKLLNNTRWRGMRIGLLGGSFNPPHNGHVHISMVALKKFRLDAVWWLVTPQNPLKPQSTSLQSRIAMCHALTTSPRIIPTGIEQHLKTNRTYALMGALKTYFPTTDFMWICGTDIAHEFNRWYHWRKIPTRMSMAVIARPPVMGLVRKTPLRTLPVTHHFKLQEKAFKPGHVHWVLEGAEDKSSSTALRQR